MGGSSFDGRGDSSGLDDNDVTTNILEGPARAAAGVTPWECARLLVLSGAGAGRACVVADEATIGRGPENALVLLDASVSRRHARIFSVGPRAFAIEDLSSRNGVSVNGTRIGPGPHRLALGDRVEIGPAVLLFTHFDQAEAQLLQAQRLQALGELASGIAHDVNNLVGAAMANIRYLRSGAAAPEDVAACLSDSEEALQRVVEMSRRLLGFARRGRLESRPHALRGLVDEAWRLTRHRARAPITIRVEMPEGLSVMGDSTQLIQVFTNLFANAADAMASGGEITVSAQRVSLDARGMSEAPGLKAGEYTRISVRDSGPGIPREILGRLFDPFVTSKPAGMGTGLGLATVQGLIASHGGQVTAQNLPGSGAEFVIHVPTGGIVDGAVAEGPERVRIPAGQAGGPHHTRRVIPGVVQPAPGSASLERA